MEGHPPTVRIRNYSILPFAHGQNAMAMALAMAMAIIAI